jgi:8-hydroxy-5-deazaflavin:NADPH oxidoreductase
VSDNEEGHAVTKISIIGLGGMARALGSRAVGAGDIVILAVPDTSAAAIVSDYGPAPTDKIIIDITNPFGAAHTELVTVRDSSAAQEIATATAPGLPVVKAFNTLFTDVLATDESAGHPVDVFLVGDDADAKATVASFTTSLGLRPLDTGDLAFSHWLEGAGLLLLGQADQQQNYALTLKILN